MKSFKWYLTEAYNIPIKEPNDIDDFTTKQDKDALIKLVNYLNSLNLDDIPIAGGADKIKIRGASGQTTQTKIKDWIEENTPELTGVAFGSGSIGKDGVKINENTQEMMVAALVLNKVKSQNISEADAIEMIDSAKGVFNKIEGTSARPELLEQFTGNFNDLATAISSSNAILKIVPNPTKVYWAGDKWHPDISKYNPPIGGVKNYNSSDIVVKSSDGIYHGFSLKKKAKSKDTDPTLINKPITGNVGILKDILGEKTVASIEQSKQRFFDNVIYRHYNKKTRNLSAKEKGELIRGISQKQMGMYLKDKRNTFFGRVFSILSNHSDEFVKSFIELLFRSKMKDIEEGGEFKFYLLTGIGRFTKGTVNVEPAEVKNTPQTIEAITKIFNSKLEMKTTPGKLQAWEEGAGAAKVFFSIFADGNKIIDLEIRYKGSYTANPQFQAVATPVFKNMFK